MMSLESSTKLYVDLDEAAAVLAPLPDGHRLAKAVMQGRDLIRQLSADAEAVTALAEKAGAMSELQLPERAMPYFADTTPGRVVVPASDYAALRTIAEQSIARVAELQNDMDLLQDAKRAGDAEWREQVEAVEATVACLREALRPFVEAYEAHDDPGTSDLDNEQPVAWHVSLVREILAGCEGVTPGPYGAGDSGFIYDPNGRVVADMVLSSDKNTDHFTRLDPATVAALCNMALDRAAAEAKIIEQTAEIERLTRERDEARDTIEQAEAAATWNDDMRSAPKMTPVLVRLGKKAVGQRDGMHGAVQVAANRGRGWISIPGMWSCDPIAWCRIPNDGAALAEIGGAR